MSLVTTPPSPPTASGGQGGQGGGIYCVRLGPDDPDARYGPGVWHEAGADGLPICGTPCSDYHDKFGNLKPGTWEYEYRPHSDCLRCARVLRR